MTKLMLKKTPLSLLIASVVVSSATFANEFYDADPQGSNRKSDSHFYAGARAGMAIFDDLCEESVECENETVGYSVFGGYQFNSWFALETVVNNFGAPQFQNGTVLTEEDVYGAELAGKFTGFQYGPLALYARLGASYQNFTSRDDNFDRIGALAALGLEYDITKRWALRAEYEYIHGIADNEDVFEDALTQFASLGVLYRFGQPDYVPPPPPEPKIVEPPVVVQPEPEPEPVTILIDDSQQVEAIFDFDKHKLNDPNRLLPVVSQLRDAEGKITIKAHTDSIGTEKYNQKLSERRAQSAVDFFTQEGIDRDKLVPIGMGETTPAVSNSTLEGRKKNRRLEIEYQRLEKK